MPQETPEPGDVSPKRKKRRPFSKIGKAETLIESYLKNNNLDEKNLGEKDREYIAEMIRDTKLPDRQKTELRRQFGIPEQRSGRRQTDDSREVTRELMSGTQTGNLRGAFSDGTIDHAASRLRKLGIPIRTTRQRRKK